MNTIYGLNIEKLNKDENLTEIYENLSGSEKRDLITYLYKNGWTINEITKCIGKFTNDAVRYHLIQAGLHNPKPRLAKSINKMQILKDWNSGMTAKAIAEKYELSEPSIHGIICGLRKTDLYVMSHIPVAEDISVENKEDIDESSLIRVNYPKPHIPKVVIDGKRYFDITDILTRGYELQAREIINS